MKAGAVIPPNQFPGVVTSENEYVPPDNINEENNENNYEMLYRLNFDDGELEMLFDEHHDLTIGDIINKYLEIARANPFNQNWQTYEDAEHANNDLNVLKSNGIPYTKRDIAKDTLNSYYNEDETQEGGRRHRKYKKRKTRKNRKSRKSRKHRKSRHRRRR